MIRKKAFVLAKIDDTPDNNGDNTLKNRNKIEWKVAWQLNFYSFQKGCKEYVTPSREDIHGESVNQGGTCKERLQESYYIRIID